MKGHKYQSIYIYIYIYINPIPGPPVSQGGSWSVPNHRLLLEAIGHVEF